MEEVINIIKRRYIHERAIYTWCGIALVAVNPYQEQDIYSDQVVETYHSASHSVYFQLDPHIYAVTEDAYSKLELNNKDQSIIVSGESGAGKTVSAKHAMRYLVSIASSRKKSVHKIEQQVLASNPIMEAIGNARTSRNDNSSRFGKYIQIYFDKHQHRILGANMRTYLLEKSRVAKQQVGERNFHIFYQLLNYALKNPEKMAHLHLIGKSEDGSYFQRNFNYLNDLNQASQLISNDTALSPNTASRDDLRRFKEALHTLNIDVQRIQIIYRIIAGILHGGNINFNVEREDADEQEDDCKCSIDIDNDFHFQKCCELIGLEPGEFSERLTTKLLRSGPRDIIKKPLNRSKAEYSRDAMLKFIYECFFTWLVALINISLSGSKDQNQTADITTEQLPQNGTELITEVVNNNSKKIIQSSQLATTPKSPSAKKSILEHVQQHEPHFIGVLDIYGFENFKVNSFEQFCINYANEKLQQQYNQHVFKLEQEEYVREGIDWTFIEYSDNQPVIDVIESRPIGILNLLDEECKMPKGTDKSWCAKLYDQLLPKGKMAEDSAPLKKPKLNFQISFTISHYAEDVNYNVTTFLEKNRDALAEEQCEILRSSKVLSFIFEDPLLSDGVKPKMRTQRSATVGWQFRGSLAALINTLNCTEPHYVRCIKPNDEKKAFNFNEKRAIEQLRACGVYETIRISNNGFPSRWLYKDFARRYCILIYGTEEFRSLAQRSALADGNQQMTEEECKENENLKMKTNLSDSRDEINMVNDEKQDIRQQQQELIQQKRHFMYLFSSADVRSICQKICMLAYDEKKSQYKHLRTEGEQDYIDTLIKRHGNKPSAIYQFGKSKLFFRAGQVSYLERIRNQRLREYSITIQRHVRGWLARRAYIIRREAYYEQLRKEAATLASLQEQALLQAELEAREAAEKEAALEEEQKRFQQRELQSIESLTSSSENIGTTVGNSTLPRTPVSRLGSVYHMLVDLMYGSVQPLIISAVLEYEALDQPEPFESLDSQFSNRSQTPQQQFHEESMENLLKELDRFHDLARKFFVPEDISIQTFRQIFYLICAHSLNQLLIRRDLCQFKKAMQINFNLSCLVQWCRERFPVRWKEIVEQLDPITQATKLLQTRKSSDDIATIEEVCNKLRPSQIIKILNLYTSSYEERITTDFVHELEEYLIRTRNQRQKDMEIDLEQNEIGQQSSDKDFDDDENNNNSGNNFNQNDLLMDTKYYFPFIEQAQ